MKLSTFTAYIVHCLIYRQLQRYTTHVCRPVQGRYLYKVREAWFATRLYSKELALAPAAEPNEQLSSCAHRLKRMIVLHFRDAVIITHQASIRVRGDTWRIALRLLALPAMFRTTRRDPTNWKSFESLWFPDIYGHGLLFGAEFANIRQNCIVDDWLQLLLIALMVLTAVTVCTLSSPVTPSVIRNFAVIASFAVWWLIFSLFASGRKLYWSRQKTVRSGPISRIFKLIKRTWLQQRHTFIERLRARNFTAYSSWVPTAYTNSLQPVVAEQHSFCITIRYV